jgi:predicted DNA-binding protein YlxM (UPF0122 family)
MIKLHDILKEAKVVPPNTFLEELENDILDFWENEKKEARYNSDIPEFYIKHFLESYPEHEGKEKAIEFIADKYGLYDLLEEARVTPPRRSIEDLIAKAQKELNFFSNKVESYADQLASLSISDVINNPSQLETLTQNLENTERVLRNLFGEYFDIYEPYDIFERPDNVRELEKISDKLDNLGEKADQLKEAADSLEEAAKYYQRAFE